METTNVKLTSKLDKKLVFGKGRGWNNFILNFNIYDKTDKESPLIAILKNDKLKLNFNKKELKRIINMNSKKVLFRKIILSIMFVIFTLVFSGLESVSTNKILLIDIIVLCFSGMFIISELKILDKLKKEKKLKKEILKNLDKFYKRKIFKYNINLNNENSLYIYKSTVKNKGLNFNTVFDLPEFIDNIAYCQKVYNGTTYNTKDIKTYELLEDIFYMKTNISDIFYSNKIVFFRKSNDILNKINIIKTSNDEIKEFLDNKKLEENEFVIKLELSELN